MTRTVATKLAQARKLIEPRGAWIQEDFEIVRANGQHAYCMSGALLATNLPPSGYAEARAYLLRATNYHGLIAFNDAPNRKKREVIEAFKRAEQLAGAE